MGLLNILPLVSGLMVISGVNPHNPHLKNDPHNIRKSEEGRKFQHNLEVVNNLPDSFDPRHKWPKCPSLNEIRDQGKCGACWAVGPAQVMTDRVCIQSEGTKNFHFSAEDVLSCTNTKYGCGGGSPLAVWKKWSKDGFVSGGNYNSSQGCKPYSLPPCPDHMRNCLNHSPTPVCRESCNGYTNSYFDDKKRGKPYYKLEGEKNIMAELYTKGPVVTVMWLYADFADYTGGIYQHRRGDRVGPHVVKLIGWGAENGKKYWLVANSWGTSFGENGFFKILRGSNECDIEKCVTAANPLLEGY